MIVGSWVVMAASYEARAHGIGSGMGGANARRLCPDAVVVRARWEAYVEASRAVFDVFARTSPVVEGLSIDEAFLDVRGMGRSVGTPLEIALRLRRDVREQTGLPITVGVATTKSLAKVASALAKPDGLMLVPPECELTLLHRLPVERLWGVGPATAPRLHRRGLARVGQIAALEESELVALLGPGSGRHLYALAHNRDPRPVHRKRRRRTFGAQSALGRRPRSPEALDAVLLGLVDRVTRRMRTSRPRRAHRGAAAALRRLLGRHPLAHPAPADRRLGADPGRGARPAGRGAADRRRAGPDPAGHHGRQPRRRGASGGQLQLPLDDPAATRPWTTPSTRCATASARRRSPGPRSSGATRASPPGCRPSGAGAGGAPGPEPACAAASHSPGAPVWPAGSPRRRSQSRHTPGSSSPSPLR